MKLNNTYHSYLSKTKLFSTKFLIFFIKFLLNLSFCCCHFTIICAVCFKIGEDYLFPLVNHKRNELCYGNDTVGSSGLRMSQSLSLYLSFTIIVFKISESSLVNIMQDIYFHYTTVERPSSHHVVFPTSVQ